MKKFKTVLIVFCALVYCFAVIKANFFSVSESVPFSDDTPYPSLAYITEDKRKEFIDLDLINEGVCTYPLKMAKRLGYIGYNFKRITLYEAKEMVAQSGSFGNLLAKMHKRQPYCDWSGGGRQEYWLDREGTRMIVLVKSDRGAFCYYETYNDNGKRVYSEQLLSGTIYS